jgi:hypothetical protein
MSDSPLVIETREQLIAGLGELFPSGRVNLTVAETVDLIIEAVRQTVEQMEKEVSGPLAQPGAGSTGGAPTAIAWFDKGGAPRAQLDVFWYHAHAWRDCKDIDEEYYAKFRVMRDAMFSLIDLALGAASRVPSESPTEVRAAVREALATLAAEMFEHDSWGSSTVIEFRNREYPASPANHPTPDGNHDTH